jgi:hypothetical protein
LIYVITGWAEGLKPLYSESVTAEFLLPIAMLAVSYRRAEAPVQERLRWMLRAMDGGLDRGCRGIRIGEGLGDTDTAAVSESAR